VPKAPKFQDFTPERHRCSPDSLGEGASLDYLFAPFNPGKIEPSKPFQPLETGSAPVSQYRFQDLDPRDSNIINTLDRAEKKAKEIEEAALAKSREMEEAAQVSAARLSSELESKALADSEAKAQALLEEARLKAEEIVREARVNSGDVEKKAQEAADLEARAQALMEKAQAREGQNQEKAGELEKRAADLESERANLLTEMEATKAETLKKAQKSGYGDGYTQGLMEGREKGASEVLEKAGGMFEVLRRMNDIWEDLFAANGPLMAELAVEAAEAIALKEIENGRGLAAGAFRQAINYLHKSHEAVFRVRPEDLSELEEARAGLRDKFPGLTNLIFQADPALGPGDLIMSSDVGSLDATMKARKDKVMGALREALAQGRLGSLPQAAGKCEEKESESPASAPEATLPQKGEGQDLGLSPEDKGQEGQLSPDGQDGQDGPGDPVPPEAAAS
jgi:flagellar biosynthesis/type III secretory pathway protein FliH